MALPLPFLNGASRKRRAQMIAVDLGSRTTKAVLFERRGEILAMTRYALLDAPIFEKKISPELLGEHLRAGGEGAGQHHQIHHGGGGPGGCDGATDRTAADSARPMRQILKVNHKNYLQQDLPNHVFDCYVIPPRTLAPNEKNAAGGTTPKLKVLAAAAKQQLAADFMVGRRNWRA